MLGTDEIVTYHHVASFTPVIDGDVADARAACCTTRGAGTGRFWESLAIQNTHLVRTRLAAAACHEWTVVVGLGSLDLFEDSAADLNRPDVLQPRSGELRHSQCDDLVRDVEHGRRRRGVNDGSMLNAAAADIHDPAARSGSRPSCSEITCIPSGSLPRSSGRSRCRG